MIVVTGAGGFVGSNIVQNLRDGGLPVVGLVRREPAGSFRVLAEWTEASLREAFVGATAVVHAASVVHKPGAPAAAYERFNREGTRALVSAARSAGVRQVVFLSSIKVYGDTPAGIVDENTALHPQDPYSGTKLEAERIVLDAGASQGLTATILRLVPVYGRGDKGNVRRVISAIARGRFMLPGDGSTRKSLVHISTVVEVTRAALTQGRDGVFVVADRSAPSMRELADAVAEALGKPRPRSLPAWLLRAAALPVEGIFHLLGRSPPVSRELIWKSLQPTVCSPGKAEQVLGVPCHVDLKASIRDEVQWLRELSLI